MLLAIAGLVQVQSAKTQEGHASDRNRLIGAWHLEHIDSPEPEGKPSDIPQPKGMLIYTRDGHMSVQLMYPKTANNQSNQYVQDGYEASFGSYEVDEAKHNQVVLEFQQVLHGILVVGVDGDPFTALGRRIDGVQADQG